MPEFYMRFARKINKIPKFYMIYARKKINKMPEFYTIFARKSSLGGSCRRRVGGSERRDPVVEVVCGSWRYVWCKIATKFAYLFVWLYDRIDIMEKKVGQKN